MKRNPQTLIVLSYGSFLGWLLAFPFSGPILHRLADSKGISSMSLGLAYIGTPVLFLALFLISPRREERAKQMMLAGCAVCAIGSALLLLASAVVLHVLMALMGIASVVFIMGWSYYYTVDVPIADKMKAMALVILTGNVIHYVLTVLGESLLVGPLVALATMPVVAAFYVSFQIAHVPQHRIQYPCAPEFPLSLMAVVCVFLFVLNLNGGLMAEAIEPYFRARGLFSAYYGMMPYILTLALYYLCAHRVPRLFPVYFATSLLGLAYVSFSMFGHAAAGYYLTQTFAQAGWALIDVFLWSLLGEIASMYGRPLTISSLGLGVNLAAVSLGAILGARLVHTSDGNVVAVVGLTAVSIVFATFFVVPFMNARIERDLVHRMKKTDAVSRKVLLPEGHSLTPRELEITMLLFQGHSNKDIAKRLSISENTLKVHARHIYAKLGVSNKKELFQLALESTTRT